jgi:hypothetical protein
MIFLKIVRKKINYDGFNKAVCKFTDDLNESFANVNFQTVLMKPFVNTYGFI